MNIPHKRKRLSFTNFPNYLDIANNTAKVLDYQRNDTNTCPAHRHPYLNSPQPHYFSCSEKIPWKRTQTIQKETTKPQKEKVRNKEETQNQLENKV